jgi:hypothetical protein
VRQHNHIGAKQLRQPYFYSRWYRCNNPDCRTREVMPAEFIVWNDNEAAQRLRRLQAIREQLRSHGEWGEP